MQISTLGVVGAGQMGNGIAQVFAASGFGVVLQDVSDEALSRGLKTIEKSLDRLLAKNKIAAADKQATLQRIRSTTNAQALADADLVVEAATENLELKIKILQELEQICKPA